MSVASAKLQQLYNMERVTDCIHVYSEHSLMYIIYFFNNGFFQN